MLALPAEIAWAASTLQPKLVWEVCLVSSTVACAAVLFDVGAALQLPAAPDAAEAADH